MRFLLINTNPAVSKLVNASLNRIGHETREISSYDNLPLDSFIAVIVDSDSYDASHIDDLLAVSIAPSLIYLKQQDMLTPSGFQYALSKPFLPTDFITFIVSILKKNPELKRFITPEAEEFVNMLPEEGRVEATEEKAIEISMLTPEEQAIDNDFINLNFYDDLQKKAPIFSVEEQGEIVPTEPIDMAFSAPKIEPDISDSAFFNLSDDISKFYSSGSEETVKKDPVTTLSNETAQSPKQQTTLPPAIDDNGDSLKSSNFVLNDKEIDKDLQIPPKEQNNNRIDFDFNIMDEVEISNPMEDALAKEDFLKEPVEEVKQFGGFEKLAKEFDDLIKPSKDETVPKEVKLPSYASEPKAQADPFKNLNEKEMKKVLQEGGLLPQSAEEIVKHEIQSVVQDSVQGLLQGNILRDVLKGLKMNITITFEDKE